MPPEPLTVVTTALPFVGEWLETAALPYTSNPLKLAWNDILLFVQCVPYLPNICLPVTPFNSGKLDELYPSPANLFCLAVHLLLSIAQLVFLLSIPVSLVWPAPFGILSLACYVAGFLCINKLLCEWLLNGPHATLKSQVDLSAFQKREDEQWVFLNGVAAGQHWLQCNIDRIALSFGRPVLGVHNPTTGIVFDVVQCLIQRDFSYATQDVRNAYSEIKKALSQERIKKVVFIVHSQGGIEGSLILDWLFADVPGKLTQKLEVYSFGNAANHVNNPEHAPDHYHPKNKTPRDVDPDRRAIRHIEHYANSRDFVSRWGVLYYASTRAAGNRYRGRVYEQNRAGHQFNQHYMDTMFPLDDQKGYGLVEENPFMSTAVKIAEDGQSLMEKSEKSAELINPANKVVVRNLTNKQPGGDSTLSSRTRQSECTVGELSRLWMYRNGRVPID